MEPAGGMMEFMQLLEHVLRAIIHSTYGPVILTFLLLVAVWRVTHRHRHRHYWRGGALIAWLVPAFHLASRYGVIDQLAARLH
jgi:hypothetical protein